MNIKKTLCFFGHILPEFWMNRDGTLFVCPCCNSVYIETASMAGVFWHDITDDKSYQDFIRKLDKENYGKKQKGNAST